MPGIERETKRESERGAEGEAGSSASAVEACGDCEVEKGGSSSGDDLSDEDNLPSDTKEGVAISRCTQARPKLRSRKSQATLGEFLKCAERKLKIRLLQSKTEDYAHREKNGKQPLGD